MTWPARIRAVVVVLAVANGAVWGSAALLRRPADGPASLGAGPAAAALPRSAEAVGSVPALPVFATARGIRLSMVSAKTIAVAFHEASYRDAVPLRPRGVCGRCRNPTKFDPPPPRLPGLRYLVTASRGRRTAATSAVDLVLPRGAEVLAPVSGVVARVKRYRLYGGYPDVRVEIRPDGGGRRRVVLLHLAGVRLAAGERVEASATRIGVARRFRFESQVDRYVDGRYPHVHLEVKDPAARGAATIAA